MESILGGSHSHQEDLVHVLKTVQAHENQKLHMVVTIQVLKKVGRPSEHQVQLKNRPVEHRCGHVTDITEVTGLEDAEADAEYDAAFNEAIRVIQEVVTHINDQIEEVRYEIEELEAKECQENQ